MSDLQQAISRLTRSSHYQELATYKPPFDPFEVTGITYRERSHSKVLAWLLEDAVNKEFRQKFISWIFSKLKYNNLFPGTDEQVKVRLEHGDDKAGRIDVFAHFPELKLVVAIEVKIWAGEQDRQIGRYQDFLNCKYPNCRKVVIFLTPSGTLPKTSEPKTDVCVLNMSWGEVAQIIGSMKPNLGEENDLRVQFCRHLDKRIVMNESEEKRRRVRELLCEDDNARILQPILDNLPTLLDFSGEWQKIVAEVCGKECRVEEDSLELKTYRERYVLSELKIRVPAWCDAGLPFTLMLSKYDEAVSVRILLHNNDYDKHKEQLHKFARTNKEIVNDEFPPAEGWTGWRAVLAGDGSESYPPGTDIDAEIFYHYEKLKKQVKENLERQMRPLLDPIQDWLKEKV